MKTNHLSYSSILRFQMMVAVLFLCVEIQGQTPQYTFSGGSVIGNVSPFGTTGNTRKQWIYTPSNFLPAPPAGYISTIYFKTSASPISSTYTNLLVNMGSTTLSSFVTGPFITAGMDTVFFAGTHTVNIISSGPWLAVTLQTPFYFNGSSNFLVDVSQAGYTSAITIQQQTVTGRSLYGAAGASTATVQDRLVEFGFDLAPGSHDIGLEGFINPADTVCEGIVPCTVTLKNHGTNNLSSAKIGWKVNNVVQPVYSWSGSLAPNASSMVTIGSYTFNYGLTYAIQAYAYEPNGGTDSIHGNDTVVKPEVILKPLPWLHFPDTSYYICPGDSVNLTGTLTGTPPWNFVFSDGITSIPFNNLTNPSFSLTLHPTVTTHYTFVSFTDSMGCVNPWISGITVSILPAAPAVITPSGSTAACLGDSVTLMASIGLNFQYQWYKNGVHYPSSSTYVLHAFQSGAYTVKVSAPGMCSNISAPVNIIIHPLPVVTLGNDTAVLPSTILILDAGSGFSSYLWSTGATTQQLLANNSGTGIGVKTLWVQVTDNNGCKGTDTIRINFTPNPGIAETNGEPWLSVFPNPTSGDLAIRFVNFLPGEIILEIFSQEGKMISRQTETISHPDNTVRINLKDMPNGLYMIKTNGECGMVTRPFIISK